MEDERKYPIKESKFKELIEPFLEESKQKLGRPTNVVFVDGSIVPLHRHGGGAFKKKGGAI